MATWFTKGGNLMVLEPLCSEFDIILLLKYLQIPVPVYTWYDWSL